MVTAKLSLHCKRQMPENLKLRQMVQWCWRDGRASGATLPSAWPGAVGVMAQPPLPKRPKMPAELPGEDRDGDTPPHREWQREREREREREIHQTNINTNNIDCGDASRHGIIAQAVAVFISLSTAWQETVSNEFAKVTEKSKWSLRHFCCALRNSQQSDWITVNADAHLVSRRILELITEPKRSLHRTETHTQRLTSMLAVSYASYSLWHVFQHLQWKFDNGGHIPWWPRTMTMTTTDMFSEDGMTMNLPWIWRLLKSMPGKQASKLHLLKHVTIAHRRTIAHNT